MFNFLLIVFGIDPSVTFGGFPSKLLFSQVYLFLLAGSFQFSSRSTLPSTHFVYFLACYKRLSIFKRVLNLFDRICMYSDCSFRYTFFSSFWASCFWSLIIVGFILLHRDAVFLSARLFLTANISHWTLILALSLVGKHSAAASMWALMKFLYSLFKVFLISPEVHQFCSWVLTYIYR